MRTGRRDLLAALTVLGVLACLLASVRTLHDYTDWVDFNVGGRVLVHYHGLGLYSGGRLQLYVDNPGLQIGPPALLLVAAFEWLPPDGLYWLVSALLALSAPVALMAALTVRRRADLRGPVVAAAALVAVIWGYQLGAWKHLDDAIALTLAVLALRLVARGGAWWLVAVLLGTASAAKPWAVVLVPVLLGLPRADRARAALVVIASAAVWWLPFVLAAPDTVGALGGYDLTVRPGSVLALLGEHRGLQGLRPVQLAVATGAGALVAVRRGWLAAPLAALVTRLLLDPYAYTYYALGPLLFGLVLDAGGRRRVPLFTALTLGLDLVPRWVGVDGTALSLCRLAWCAAVLAAITRLPRPVASQPEQG